MSDFDELLVEAENAYKAGDNESGDILLQEAEKLKTGYQQPNPPEGMVLDPNTGQMVDTVAEAQRQNTGAMGKFGALIATSIKGMPYVGEYFDEGIGQVGGPVLQGIARQRTKQFETNHPKTAMAGQVAAGLSAAIPAAMVAAPAVMAAAPVSLAGQIGAGALTAGLAGVSEGYVSGYGSGTDPQSRSENAKTRAMIGGGLGVGLGGLAPVAAKGISKLSQSYRNLRTNMGPMKTAGLDKHADMAVSRTLDADDILSPEGIRRMRQSGNETMLADAGPSTQSLLDTAMQRGGKAAVRAGKAIDARVAREGGNMNVALDRALGRPVGVQSTGKGIAKGTSTARNDAYTNAYNSPINYADDVAVEMEGLLERVGGGVIKKANRLMDLDGHSSKQIMATIADDGSVTFKTMPDVRQIDYITRALKEEASSGEGAGVMGGQTALGSKLQTLSTSIRNNLRTLVPAYGDALDTAADTISRRNALINGSKAFKPGVTRDEFADMIDGMSKPELMHFKQGIRSTIDDTLANVKRAVIDGNMEAREATKLIKDLSSRANRDKLTLLMGKRQSKQLFNAIDRAGTALNLRASVAQNSKTFARQQVQRTIDGAVEGGAIRQMASGHPLISTQNATQILTGNTPVDKLAREDALYGNIVDALTTQHGGNAANVAGGVQMTANQLARNKAMAQITGRRGAAAGALGLYQSGRNYGNQR